MPPGFKSRLLRQYVKIPKNKDFDVFFYFSFDMFHVCASVFLYLTDNATDNMFPLVFIIVAL